MLDDLLGRAELKERIEELEAERERLQSQLEAESDRRTDAVRARQEAQERVNRLEDRIADLEGKLDRFEDDEAVPEPRGVESMRGERLATVLDRLESVETGPESALTAVVDAELPDAVREALGDHAAVVDRAAPCAVLTDDAGVVAAALTTPTDPEPRVEWADGFTFERPWFEPTGEYALALVRSDLFALGRYRGRERVDFEGFQSDVEGNHSKGGFSQGRFERRRDAQVDDHLERCRAAVEDREVDRLYVVGERTALDEFDDVADATAAVDATGDPEAALDDAFDRFWTVRCYRI
jgi:peptide subunit release factor 1 (eRF1)